jgi:hypothetical protein
MKIVKKYDKVPKEAIIAHFLCYDFKRHTERGENKWES